MADFVIAVMPMVDFDTAEVFLLTFTIVAGFDWLLWMVKLPSCLGEYSRLMMFLYYLWVYVYVCENS